MRFLIMQLLFLGMLFFTGCQGPEAGQSQEYGSTLMQEAYYLRTYGEEERAQEKANLVKVYGDALLQAEAALFLGEAVSLDGLAECYKTFLLRADKAFHEGAFDRALEAYEKGLNLMEQQLSETYDQRAFFDGKTLGVYQQRLAMRLVQLKMSFCLAELSRDKEMQEMLARVILHKPWDKIQKKLEWLMRASCDSTLFAHDHVGHTLEQFAHLTEAKERYLLEKSLALAVKKGVFQ